MPKRSVNSFECDNGPMYATRIGLSRSSSRGGCASRNDVIACRTSVAVAPRRRLEKAVALADVGREEDAVIVPERRVRGANALRRTGRSRRVDEAHVVPRLARAADGRPLRSEEHT